MSRQRPYRDQAPKAGNWADERRRDRGGTVDELEELLVHGAAAVIATDLDGVITHWSTGAERLYGWANEEVVGTPIVEVLGSLQDQRLAEEIMDSVRRAGGWEGEFDVRRKDGTIVLAYVRHALIKDDAGRPVGILGLSMDAEAPPRRD